MTAHKLKKAALAEGVLESLLGYRLAKARLTTQALFVRHIGEPMNLRPVEFSLLMLLHANGGLTPKQLSRALALPGPHLTLLLDRLQERELIIRVRSELDRRSQQVLLSDAGQTFAQELAQRTPAVEGELQDSLSRAERAMLLELLDKLARHRTHGPDSDDH